MSAKIVSLSDFRQKKQSRLIKNEMDELDDMVNLALKFGMCDCCGVVTDVSFDGHDYICEACGELSLR